MRFIIIALVTLISACAHQPIPPKAASYDHFLAGCNIYDLQGNAVKRLNGGRCLLFDNGNYLSGDSNQLRMFDKTQQVLWSRQIHTHHIMTKTSRGEFLIGSSEIRRFRGVPTRFDILLLVNDAGKELARFAVYDHLNDFFRLDPPLKTRKLDPFSWDQAATIHAKFEFTHINSYYEIPRYHGPAIEGFKPGSILVNSAEPDGTMFILDPSLKTIEYFRVLNQGADHGERLHDLQMLESGHLLVFNNQAGETATGKFYSSLDEIDPVSWKRTWRFVDQPPERFAMQVAGGVQQLDDDRYLFNVYENSETTMSARLINRAGKELQLISLPDCSQDVKAVKAEAFLTNNTSL